MNHFAIIPSLYILFTLCAQASLHPNLDMTFTTAGTTTYNYNGSYDWPDTPDKGNITSADFSFYNSPDSTWKLNNGSTTILTQHVTADGGRFFPGTDGSSRGTLTFTSDSGAPGKLSARGSSYGSMRIGDHQGNLNGTVNIEGGVTVEIGNIWAKASGNPLNITNGEFAVISAATSSTTRPT